MLLRICFHYLIVCENLSSFRSLCAIRLQLLRLCVVLEAHLLKHLFQLDASLPLRDHLGIHSLIVVFVLPAPLLYVGGWGFKLCWGLLLQLFHGWRSRVLFDCWFGRLSFHDRLSRQQLCFDLFC